MPNKVINPLSAYTVKETAELIGVHPVTLRKKLSKSYQTKHGIDPFIAKAQPQQLFGEWRFVGSNIHNALGTVGISFNPEKNNNQPGALTDPGK